MPPRYIWEIPLARTLDLHRSTDSCDFCRLYTSELARYYLLLLHPHRRLLLVLSFHPLIHEIPFHSVLFRGVNWVAAQVNHDAIEFNVEPHLEHCQVAP